ncbi:MAG TPA: thioredoxin family protein [Bacteroidetes bacterium]|nr:thioredoxin family protein [Bacteroidota bacterium]
MSRIIKILGTGCPKCKATSALVAEVVKANNIDATIIKVEDIMEIMAYNVLSTPVLVIDEQITVKGRVPSKSEVEKLLIN